MSARDLVGRPLVPFFDAQDNVNEALQVDAHTHEQVDVDARVWDKELGYFVYPTDSAASQLTHSMPIPIKKTAASTATLAQDGTSGSFGKMLLTPDMLSRSAPSGSGSGMEQLHNTMGMTHPVDQQATIVTANGADARSATPNRSSSRSRRAKNRSSTPNRDSRNKQRNGTTPQEQQQQQQQSTSDGAGSSGGEDRTASDSSDKSKPKKNKNDRKSRNKQPQQQQQPQTPQKSKDGDLSAKGKWAWSAFQSSPDPKSLPLPPFAAGGSSPGMGALPPPFDPPKIEERLDPPPPPLFPGRPPSMPPDAMNMMAPGPPLPPPHPSSLEHSMTQDLRRMLNIGS